MSAEYVNLSIQEENLSENHFRIPKMSKRKKKNVEESKEEYKNFPHAIDQVKE